jgi:hypothetical protein
MTAFCIGAYIVEFAAFGEGDIIAVAVVGGCGLVRLYGSLAAGKGHDINVFCSIVPNVLGYDKNGIAKGNLYMV